jgi:hypothetical protein
LESLENLKLSHTRVTDKGVADLIALEKLQKLDISYTRLTDQAAAELKKARPKLYISR